MALNVEARLGRRPRLRRSLSRVSRVVTKASNRARARGRGADSGGLGRITHPSADVSVTREAFTVSGWALFSPGTVSRVEVLIDGSVVGRARLGLARPDVRLDAKLRRYPAAAVCGFDWTADPAILPRDVERVRVGARVTATGGERFNLSLRGRLRLKPPQPPFEDTDGRAERLRRRTELVAARRPPRRRPGTNLVAFTHRLDHGGAQRYFFEQVRRLMEDPELSCTVVARRDGVWRDRLETIGADVHLTPYTVAGVAEYESEVEQLAAWAAQHRFDAAFVNTLDAFLAADLANRLELPSVWALHESFPLSVWWRIAHGEGGHPYVRQRIEHALAGASSLVFAADATKDLFAPYAAPERMVTAPYGLELGDIDRFRRYSATRAQRLRSSFPDDAVILLCLGTVNARKSQAILAQAFEQVADRHPRAHLVLVGDAGGKYSAAIETFLADSRLAGRCTLVPVTSDPYLWHEIADLFVLTSDIESSPISILEAMAFETPVVATSVFGVPELIGDGRNGYLCQPNDIGDIARSLDRALAADPAERGRVARAGAETVRRRHDPERYARSLRHLFDELLEEPEKSPSWEPGGVSVHA